MMGHYQVPFATKSIVCVLGNIRHLLPPKLEQQTMLLANSSLDTRLSEQKNTMNLFSSSVVLVAFVFAPCSHGQGLVTGTTDGSSSLQPWLVGFAAVVGFLFVVFVANLINRIFFSKTKDTKKEMEEGQPKLRAEAMGIENLALEPEEGTSEAKKADDQVTSI